MATKSGAMSWWAEMLTASADARIAAPARSVDAGLLEHPPPDLDDQSGLFGQRDRGGRGYRLPGWDGPTAGGPPPPRCDRRRCRRWAGTRAGARPGPRALARALRRSDVVLGQLLGAEIDDLVARAALVLHLVHGDVGGVEQLFGIVVGSGWRRRCRRWPRSPPRHRPERRVWPSSSTIRAATMLDLVDLVELLAQDDELVPGQSGQGVARAGGTRRSVRSRRPAVRRRPGARGRR